MMPVKQNITAPADRVQQPRMEHKIITYNKKVYNQGYVFLHSVETKTSRAQKILARGKPAFAHLPCIYGSIQRNMMCVREGDARLA